MVRRLALLGFLWFGLACGVAPARDWSESACTVPDCVVWVDMELGCEIDGVAGYGTAGLWADEIAAEFLLPTPPQGGPWLIAYVGFFMSGSQSRPVVIRNAGAKISPSGASPGPVLYEGWTFTPMSETWPPSGWTYVTLEATPPYPSYLTVNGGEPVMIGTRLLAGDALGLTAVQGSGVGWGLYNGSWEEDTSGWSLTPAVRIGLIDLGLSGSERTTWGAIKDLFQ